MSTGTPRTMIDGDFCDGLFNHHGTKTSSRPSPLVHLLVGPKHVHIPVRQWILTKHSPFLREHLRSEVTDIKEYLYRDKNMEMKAESPEIVISFIDWAKWGAYGKASIETHHKVYHFARKYAIRGLGQYVADRISQERVRERKGTMIRL